MGNKDYPRILLVSASVFNLYSGGGIMLTNLFQGWPVEQIAIVHSDDIQEDKSVCERFYKLGEEDYRWIWPFSLFPSLSVELNSIGSGELLRVPHISPNLKQWIQEFQPELIYTLLGNLTYIHLIKEIASLFKVPLAIHMMDDWPAVIYRKGGGIGLYMRLSMKHELQQLFSKTTLRMGICEAMCRAYEARYGYPFMSFHNAIDVSVWLPNVRRDYSTHNPFRIVYAGSIVHNAQLNSLRDICDAVANLHTSGMDIEMRLHCPLYVQHYRSCLERPPSVLMCDAPENSNVATLFASADLLVLPVNFDAESIQYIRYSMPTKVPAYMISGTPILVYGPLETAQVQYAQEEGWGYVVSRRDITAVQEAISLLATDMEIRARLGRRAQQLACQNHDAAKVRVAFRQALAGVVGGQ